jgi:hypothetical protein
MIDRIAVALMALIGGGMSWGLGWYWGGRLATYYGTTEDYYSCRILLSNTYVLRTFYYIIVLSPEGETLR